VNLLFAGRNERGKMGEKDNEEKIGETAKSLMNRGFN
jgi:hypothetical protein